MLFTLRNLGRLEEATIDLSKDLIVLTGPNNTSKTYVAHAIYGFCSTTYTTFYTVLADLLPGDEQGTDDRYDVDIVALMGEHFDQLLERICQNFTRALPDIFATDKAFAARTQVGIEVDAPEREHVMSALLGLDLRYVLHLSVLAAKKQGARAVSFTRAPEVQGQREVRDQASFPLRETAIGSLSVWLMDEVFAGILSAHILTSDRSAVQLFSRELSMKRSDLVESLLRASDEDDLEALSGEGKDLRNILRHRARRYPHATRSELHVADDLAKLSKLHSREDFGQAARDLEEDILGGGVSVTEGGEFRFRPSGSEADLQLHLASSSVRSLASLSFYLRHLARNGDFLIVDEPELNLHPDNQRKVARLLARVARAGVKVMISTHSDYVLRELNNLVMLDKDEDGSVAKEFGYRPDERLSPAQVGAYFFTGTHAQPLEVHGYGIEVETIDRETESLNRSSQRIYAKLRDKVDPS